MADLSARATAGVSLRRAYPAQFEVRGKTGTMVGIKGYATVYGKRYDMWDPMGSYREHVREGAGRTTLSQDPRVQLLLNHTGLAMAYTRAKPSPTLRLAEDSTGLEVDGDVDIARNDVHDMVHALERGDVDEMSFAFRVTRQEWNDDYTDRAIVEYNIDRGDVSVVNFGANPATEVGLRSQDFDRMEPDAIRSLMKDLERRLAVVVVNPGEDGEEDATPCPACGAKNAEDALFCNKCGASMPQKAIQRAPLGLYLALAAAQG